MLLEFKPEHLEGFEPQAEQITALGHINRETGARLLAAGPCVSIAQAERIVCCAGLIVEWEGRAVAWALLHREIGPAGMLAATRGIKRMLDRMSMGRIEAHVRWDFDAGWRWAALLGFTLEGRMRRFHNGQDWALFARVKE